MEIPIEQKEEKFELTKDILDKLRSKDGFPLGKDDDIILLSDPPYYTACPNPWLEYYINRHSKPYDPKTDKYHREPFTFDVSEGKNDPIYNAHSYHTKVPYKAIMRFILHYTDPGDLIFDGFCGTGMTGVAAQMCSLADNELKTQIDKEMHRIKWGIRKTILCDLSPIASFIAYNFNNPVDISEFTNHSKKILSEVESECQWMYHTNHLIQNQLTDNLQNSYKDKNPVEGKINYTIWSDIIVCESCTKEIIFWDIPVSDSKDESEQEINCPYCNASIDKDNPERVLETVMDFDLGKIVKKRKQVPVRIHYDLTFKNKNKIKKKRYVKKPDANDLKIIRIIDESKIPYWYPTDLMMFKGSKWGDTWRAGYHIDITNVHDFYTKRNIWILAAILKKINLPNKRLSNFILSWFTASQSRLHRLNRYMKEHNRHVGPLSGTLYLSPTQAEISPFYFFNVKLKVYSQIQSPLKESIISTQSSTDLSGIDDNSIDYIFTDPPFGDNLLYSELNFIWESWLKVFTNNKQEAIYSNVQKKWLSEYQKIMEQCFRENHRILKPGRWMTVVFHNSKNSIWMAIQEAIMRAGFIIADVRTLDKQKGTTKQLYYISGAVKQDLVISAYKPNIIIEQHLRVKAGNEEGVWSFIRQHLNQLPVFVEKNGYAEVISERQKYLLYDRMIAFHVQRGIAVPLSASDFYLNLKQRFSERDEMYFLPEQAVEYDKKKMTIKSFEQLSLFIHDEKSAIEWLRQELKKNPKTYQQIQPSFVKELHKSKHEKMLELSEILKQNFLIDDHNKWYIPDPERQSDLEKLKERILLREFEEYKFSKGKLKLFRIEAIRTGFKKCWSNQDYKTIIDISKRLPELILQEDHILLMYYDNSLTRLDL